MHLLSFFTFLAATSISVTNASFDMIGAQNAASLSTHKRSDGARQLSDSMNLMIGELDLTDSNSICALTTTRFEGEMSCNEDMTELSVEGDLCPSEYCNDDGEFCTKDDASSVVIDLPLSEDGTKSSATFYFCTTYTKATPEGKFVGFLNERACIVGKATLDVAHLFFNISGEEEPEFITEECSSSVGEEVCSCTVCGEGMIEQACPTLGVKTECDFFPYREDYAIRWQSASDEQLYTSAPSTGPNGIPDALPELGYTEFASLLKATDTGLENYLSDTEDQKFTVFPPTNFAIAQGLLLVPGLKLWCNKVALLDILRYHIVPVEYSESKLVKMAPGKITSVTAEKEELSVRVVNGFVRINDAVVVYPDNVAGNGVIHGIDNLLIPTSINVTSLLTVCPTRPPSASPSTAPSESTASTPVIISTASTPIVIMPLALVTFASILVSIF